MKFQSWQVFHLSRKVLPGSVIQSIFTQKSRQFTKWGANPATCGVTAQNPIDRIRRLLNELDNAGYGDYARAAIDYMAEPLGGRFESTAIAHSDKGTVDGEIADLVQVVGQLAESAREAIEDKTITHDEAVAVKALARAVRQEAEQIMDAMALYQSK